MKVCTKCGQAKALDSFYANPRSPDGHRGDCKGCVLAARAARYVSDPAMRDRLKQAARASRPPTKARNCRHCGIAMIPSTAGHPGVCVTCKRRLGYKVALTRQQRLAIYERDGWECQICHRPVEPSLHPNHTFAATLDHIEPRSTTLFPDDSPENLRLAHRSCNSSRGNRAARSKGDAE